MDPLERLQHQYKGFSKQPNLWLKDDFFEYQQADIPFLNTIDFSAIDTEKHHRLGKLVEVFYQKNISLQPNYSLVFHNIQIQANKHNTLGEIDFIVNTPNGTTHIELTYKFYLYKTNIDDELSRWIGPNLKDALVQKLTKLKDKQFPILHHPVTQKVLSDQNINPKNIKQAVVFKAQLFVPLSLMNHHFPNINNQCIVGYYVSYKEIDNLLPLALYHIPNKQNWLIDPKYNSVWITLIEAKIIILEQIANRQSPLVWMKDKNNFKRFFITFW